MGPIPRPILHHLPGLTELAADDISGCRALYGEVPPQPSDTTVALSATALNFADTQVNNVSNTQTVAIINTGSSLLTVTGATLTGDDFHPHLHHLRHGNTDWPGRSLRCDDPFYPEVGGCAHWQPGLQAQCKAVARQRSLWRVTA